MGRSRPDELLEELSARDLASWAEYFELEPWGWQANRVLFGLLAVVVCRIAGNDDVTIEDFFPDRAKGRGALIKTTPDALRDILIAAFGAKPALRPGGE